MFINKLIIASINNPYQISPAKNFAGLWFKIRAASSVWLILLFTVLSIIKAEPPSNREWRTIESFSDEFTGSFLDNSKWFNYNPGWTTGRAPGWFNSENVRVENGYLNLYTTDNRDGSYYTATTRSLGTIRYGYFEASIKTHKSSSTTAFWFYNQDPVQDDPNFSPRWTEIDVIEAGGNATYPAPQEKIVWQTVHYFNPHEVHYRMTEVDFVTYEDYHTYGCLWTKDTIAFFIDDEFTWGRANIGHKFPLHMLFDCEIFTSPECDPMGFGTPNPADMPSYMSVDWVRSWEDMGPVSTRNPRADFKANVISGKGREHIQALYDLNGRKMPSEKISCIKAPSGTLLIKTEKGIKKILRMP
jgi:hypothetical protein